MPGIGFGGRTIARHGGYGEALKEKIRREYGGFIGLAGRGEMIPNQQSYCEIDSDTVDKYGIPVLKFHFGWTDHEWKQARHMEQTFKEIIGTMGGSVGGIGQQVFERQGISIPGTIIHEVGTVRMGDDPRTSALNKFNQAHAVDNLFVVDGGAFVSNPDKNPTLTINALSWRASEYLAEELRTENV